MSVVSFASPEVGMGWGSDAGAHRLGTREAGGQRTAAAPGRRSADGAQAWADHFSPHVPVEQLSFTDAEHGWALGPDELFATSDAGASWQALQETPLGELTWAQRVTAGFGLAEICGESGSTRLHPSVLTGGER